MTTAVAGTNDILKAVEQQALTIHRMLWNEIKPQFSAVRDVLRQRGLLYRVHSQVPKKLRWAELGVYNGSRLSIDNDRWIVTRIDSGNRTTRVTIPSEFIGAPTAACRALARQIIADNERSTQT